MPYPLVELQSRNNGGAEPPLPNEIQERIT
jgi:hypothetical protein